MSDFESRLRGADNYALLDLYANLTRRVHDRPQDVLAESQRVVIWREIIRRMEVPEILLGFMRNDDEEGDDDA